MNMSNYILNLNFEQIKTILYNFPEIVYITDPDTYEIIFMNKNFVDLVGEDATGKKCYKAFQALEEPCSFCTNEALFKSSNNIYKWEHHNKLLDKHFFITDQLIKWPDGRKVRFEIATDITEKKKQELDLLNKNNEYYALNEEYLALNEELKSNNEELFKINRQLEFKNKELDETFALIKLTKEKFQEILDNSIDCLWQLDRRLHFIYISPSIQNMLGYHVDEMLSNPLWKYVKRAEFIKMARQALRTIMNPKQYPKTIFESSMTHKDGHEVPVEIVGKAMYSKTGKLVGVQGSTRDITERKIIEQKLKAHNEELERKVKERTIELQNKNEELKDFTYTVSHDLKAPLRAISGYAAALQEDYSETFDETGNVYLKAILQNTNKTHDLVNELLKLSRLNTKEIKKKEVDLNTIFEEQIANYSNIYIDKKVQWNFNKNLPPIYADRTLIEQVTGNLLDNALKYSSKQTVPEITIGWYEKNKDHVFFVKDNGVGFNMKYKDKLFSLFERLHQQSEFPGMGAGLAIVKKIIDKHLGNIWAESKEGEGAVFYFMIPNLNSN